MIAAASTLLMLAEAVAACASPGGARLGGGAMVVRPVGTLEPMAVQPLGPTTSVVSRPTEIQQTGAAGKTDEPAAEEPAEQCEATPVEIV
jgi:hypothetical protein